MKKPQLFSGQSMLEFALVFPLIMLLVMSFLDIGRAFFLYSSLTNAVREATRYAIVNKAEIVTAYNNPSNNSLQDKVLEYSFGLSGIPDPLEKDNIMVIPEKTGEYYTAVSIQATYTFKPITPGIKEIFGSEDGIDLTAQSRMMVSPGSK